MLYSPLSANRAPIVLVSIGRIRGIRGISTKVYDKWDECISIHDERDKYMILLNHTDIIT
jgi:hypothetical protein